MPKPGVVISFYSYKGGTGRSMALANVACLFARRMASRSGRVLVIDWDLEAPGLYRFFGPVVEEPQHQQLPGLLEYFYGLRELLQREDGLHDRLKGEDGATLLADRLPMEGFVVPDVVSNVDLMKAGRLDHDYAKLAGEFEWVQFFRAFGNAISAFHRMVAARYDYCLIDSRTGLNDISGICTSLLPEKLVVVFTPNEQSLAGALDVAGRAIQYRRESDDFRPLSVFPLPSRVELGEKALRAQWRARYQQDFEELFRRAYGIEECDMSEYFDEVQVPHVSFYAYGEKLAVFGERSEALSLGRSYEIFARRLVEWDVPWGVPEGLVPEEVRSEGGRRAGRMYDVFISHSISDTDFARALAERLRAYGLRPYHPLEDLLPGADVRESLEEALEASTCIAILIGEEGSGPWEDGFTKDALERRTHVGGTTVIPVLLPRAEAKEIPKFLRTRSFVQFKDGIDDDGAFRRFISGIRGRNVRPKVVLRFTSLDITRSDDSSGVRERYQMRFGIEIDGRDGGTASPQIRLRREGELMFAEITGTLSSELQQVLDRSELDRVVTEYVRSIAGAVEEVERQLAAEPGRRSRQITKEHSVVLQGNEIRD